MTVSTSGVLPGVRRFLREGRGLLALSLNGTTDDQRERLIPHTRTWPIGDLLEALREDHRTGIGPRGTGLVMCSGKASTTPTRMPDGLARLLRGLPAHVNLIPHNAYDGRCPRSAG